MKWIKENLGDIFGLAGISLISTGVLMFSIPIGLIITGLILVYLAYQANGGD